MASTELIFTGKDDGHTIEEFIKRENLTFGKYWRSLAWILLKDEVAIWWS